MIILNIDFVVEKMRFILMFISGKREKMGRRVWVIRGILIGVLVMYLVVPMVRAGSVKATLYTNQTKEATWPLARDNAMDEFRMTGQVLSSSKYEVRYYYGNSASTWGNNNAGKYKLDKERVVLVGKGKTVDKIITKNLCDGNFAKVVMYGNSKAEPKKECRANVVLVNH